MNQLIPSPRTPHESEMDVLTPCKGLAEEFTWGEKNRRETPRKTAARVAPLIELCKTCPIQRTCLALGVSQEYPQGVYGGEFLFVGDGQKNGDRTRERETRFWLRLDADESRRIS